MTPLPEIALGEVATFIRGINFKPDDVVPIGTTGSVACMRTKNVQETIDLSDVWGVDPQFVRRAEQYLEEGDVLISSANSWNLVGKCSWIPALPYKSSFGGFVTTLRGDTSRIDRRYLYHWFSSGRVQHKLRSFGRKTTNISNLDLSRCRKLSVPLPPLEEQRRIAAILDKADELRTKRREAIAKLDTLAQSIFIDMFGDPVTNPMGLPEVALNDVSKFIRGITFKPDDVVSHGTQGSVACMRTKNVQKSLDLSDVFAISSKFVKRPEQYLELGDILISSANSWNLVGKCCWIPVLSGRSTFGGFVTTLRGDNNKIDRNYLYHWFSSVKVQQKLRGFGRRTTNISNLDLSRTGKMLVPFPTLEQQREYSEHVSSLQAVYNNQLSELKNQNALFSSLQQRAFKGEL